MSDDLLANAVSAVIERLDRLIGYSADYSPDVAFGGASIQETLNNYPVAGKKRVVTSSRGRGGIFSATASVQDLVKFNSGRTALSLVNVGTVGCYVYLARAGEASNGGVFTGYIGPNGSWDGKVSDALWCGHVSVQAASGETTTLAWGEL